MSKSRAVAQMVDGPEPSPPMRPADPPQPVRFREVVLEGMGTALIPRDQAIGFHFVHARKTYFHVGEDAQGRRIFRRDG